MAPRIPTPPEVPVVAGQPSADAEEPVIAKGTRDVAAKVPLSRDEVNERVTLIAHDFKTPLSIITLETQLLAERLSALGLPAAQASLERIGQNAAYLDRLIGDLLALGSVDAGAFHVRLDRVDVPTMLQQTLERAVSSVDRNRVTLDIRKTLYVHGDRHRLERVVANLIGNALKFSTGAVTVSLDKHEKRARVTVTDRGRGLTEEHIATLFDRDHLGLYISRMIIETHGGQIGVTSTPGKGSQFFFDLDTIL